MIRTVADLIAALQKVPQDLPVLAGCHYDNDDALTNNVEVHVQPVFQTDGEYHMGDDPNWPTPGGFLAVTVS